ncbi:MAG TPA: phosphotransferase [Steroidobacteraceae bacterium]|jgi:aminoglycoside/choline kinase family phosphotransferase|nr:phosphotransferase [Steroidobacteraceae bacterium]
MLKNDARLSLIRSWLTRDLGWRIGRISVASADASFRRYFRVSRGDVDPAAWAPRADSLIIMDAPPGKEDVAPYLKVSALLEQAGAHVPHVHSADLKRGFVAMEDLGDTQFLSRLKTGRGVDKLYGEALTTLANIQVRGLRAAAALEPYDRAPLERELNVMPEWFLGKHLRLELSPEERALLTVTFEFLINEALLQPQVFVHRDYHSRNLMVLPQDNKGGPGVIDFQDALRGPIGYDLVSLLKDCYISWSRERVERWVKGYRRVLGNLGANVGDSEYQFMRWFDLIGVQRHLKVLGVFARLWHRDGKIGYLADLPLTLDYVRDACRRYPELVEFERWLEWRVVPQLALANARQKEKPRRRKSVVKKRVQPKRKKAGPKKIARVTRAARTPRQARKTKTRLARKPVRLLKRAKKRVKARKRATVRRRSRRLHK